MVGLIKKEQTLWNVRVKFNGAQYFHSKNNYTLDNRIRTKQQRIIYISNNEIKWEWKCMIIILYLVKKKNIQISDDLCKGMFYSQL